MSKIKCREPIIIFILAFEASRLIFIPNWSHNIIKSSIVDHFNGDMSYQSILSITSPSAVFIDLKVDIQNCYFSTTSLLYVGWRNVRLSEITQANRLSHFLSILVIDCSPTQLNYTICESIIAASRTYS